MRLCLTTLSGLDNQMLKLYILSYQRLPCLFDTVTPGLKKNNFCFILSLKGSPVLGLFLQILDQYKESRDARKREGAATTGSLPKSVILIGHSMGGFVARAATIHPHLRKSAVETILTLSSPHQ